MRATWLTLTCIDWRGTVGISSIYERALIAGGTAAVEATPGKGTSIVVEVPILEMTGTDSGT